MLHDVDQALRAMVERDALRDTGVEIAFEAPTKDWVARRNAPTVNMYLYDIREDVLRREVAYEGERDSNGRVTARKPPSRRFKLSYLVTAWTQRPEDEHRLLDSLLACFIVHEIVPDDALNGGVEGPLLVTVGLPPPQDRSLSDIWTALGGELKPSLDLVVNAPFDTARVLAAGPPVLEDPRFRFDGDGEVAGRRGRGARRGDPAVLAEERVQAGKDGAGRGFIFKELET